MSGWDVGAVSSAPLNLRGADATLGDEGGAVRSYVDAQNQFAQFLRSFTSNDQATFKYRDELRANYNEGQYYVRKRNTSRDASAPLQATHCLRVAFSLCADPLLPLS